MSGRSRCLLRSRRVFMSMVGSLFGSSVRGDVGGGGCARGFGTGGVGLQLGTEREFPVSLVCRQILLFADTHHWKNVRWVLASVVLQSASCDKGGVVVGVVSSPFWVVFRWSLECCRPISIVGTLWL